MLKFVLWLSNVQRHSVKVTWWWIWIKTNRWIRIHVYHQSVQTECTPDTAANSVARDVIHQTPATRNTETVCVSRTTGKLENGQVTYRGWANVRDVPMVYTCADELQMMHRRVRWCTNVQVLYNWWTDVSGNAQMYRYCTYDALMCQVTCIWCANMQVGWK